MAARLVDVARRSDTVGRMGGGELVVVCAVDCDFEEATASAQRIHGS